MSARALSWSERLVLDNACGQQPVPFIECPRHVAAVLRIPAESVDADALSRAVDALMERHPVLRSVYGPGHAVAGHVAGALRVLSVTPCGCAAARQQLERDELNREFDLVSGYPLRSALIDGGDGFWTLVLTTHHVAMDGWSRRVLLRDLEKLYRQQVTGVPADLVTLGASYEDYVTWQTNLLGGTPGQAAREFWRRRLEEGSDIRLPADGSGAAAGSTQMAGRCLSDLSGDAVRGLRLLSQQMSVTLATTLLGGFVVLLSKLTKATRVTVGVPVADRPRSEFEHVVGLFMNVLPVRVDVSDSQSFVDLIAHTKRGFEEAYAHRSVPYGYLVRDRARATGGAYPPFRAVLNVANVRRPSIRLGNAAAQTGEALIETPSYADFSMHVAGDADMLRCTLLFDANRFSVARMGGMVAEFWRLLTAATASPDASIALLAR